MATRAPAKLPLLYNILLMKTKIDLKIKPPKKQGFAIDTPPDMFKMNTLMVFSGKKQGGKTVACTNYVNRLFEHKIIDDMIVCSATYQSNKEMYVFPHEENIVCERGK